MNRSERNAKRLQDAAELTIKNGGGTFVAGTLSPTVRQTGYAVGLADGTASTAWHSESDIERAIENVNSRFPDAPYIGTWIEEDHRNGECHCRVSVDPVIILSEVSEAIMLARALRQTAIWSLATGQTLKVQ
jgi:hypothetical protein